MDLISISYSNIFIGLFLAVIFGVILGFERNIAGKMAGMRTYALVCLGSALFTSVSKIMVGEYFKAGLTNIEPLHLIAQILTGIGFIGAGLVIFRGNKLTGLTTAAGLWVTAGVGMACGFGLYSLALFTTGLTLFVFTVLWLAERNFVNVWHDKLEKNRQEGREEED